MDAEICRKLRWKGMFIDAEPDDTVKGTSDGFCWCVLTMTCMGPDGRVADREACGHGRSCFEPR